MSDNYFEEQPGDGIAVRNIRADLKRHKETAESIIALARRKCETMINKAMLEAYEVKEEASKRGYDDGFEKGLLEGQKKGEEDVRQRMSETLSRLDTAEQEYLNKISGLMKSVEPRVIELLETMLGALVKREIDRDDTLVLRTVKDAAKSLTTRDKVLLKVNKADIAKIIENTDLIVSSSANITGVDTVVADEVDKGGCIIDTSAGIVDARIKSQMEVVLDALKN